MEELARIMNDTDSTNPAQRPHQPESPDDEPLDLGLGDQGLAELFGDRRFDDAAQMDNSFEQELSDSQAAPADRLFDDLDFSQIDLPGLDETPAEPEPLSAPEPSLTAHLTPRAAPAPISAEPPADYGDVQEEDLLAAMDALALDEPTPGQKPLGTPPPFLQPDVEEPAPTYAPEPDFALTAQTDDTSFVLQGDSEHDEGFGRFEESEDGERKSGPGKMVLFALAAVALLGVGGVGVFGLLSGGGGENAAPQVIAAPEGEIKVEPVATEETQPQPGDAVFSSLDDQDGTQGSPRVVLPQPSNEGLPLRSGERLPSADIAPAAPGSTASRAVRTVTVRADGTVVESTVPPAASAPDVEVEAASTRPVEVVSVSPSGVSIDTQPITDAVSAAQTAAQTATQRAQSAAQAALEAATQPVSAPTPPPAPVSRPQTVQTQPVQTQPVQSAPAASSQQQTPIQLATPATAPTQPTTLPQQVPTQPAAPVAAQPTPAATPASVPAGDFIVQLASLRTEEEARATFDRLQARFGSILSGFGPNIQRADLGDRGIYHRVRIGPMDRAAADSICQRYQSAGGDCFVQRQ